MTVSSTPLLTKQRSFGLLEKYQVSKTLTKSYGSVTCTAHLQHQRHCRERNLTLSATKVFYLSLFYSAITRLVRKYPMLSVVPREYDKATAHFVHTSAVPLDKMISVQEQEDQLEAAISLACDRELLADTEADIPPWRLEILVQPQCLDRCTVIFVAHHVIVDGLSLTLFWHQLLKELNNCGDDRPSLSGRNDWMIDTGTIASMSLASPMEARHTTPKPTFWEYGVLIGGLLKKKLLPASLLRSVEVWQGDAPAIPGERHCTVIQCRQLSGHPWQSFVQVAKTKYRISVHAALHACFLLAWAEVYPDQYTEMATPINCRQAANAHNEIGNFVGVYKHLWAPEALQHPPLPTATKPSTVMTPTTITKDDPLVWRLATHYHHTLQSNKDRSCIGGQFLGLLKYPSEYIEYWQDIRKEHRMGRSGGLEHSDLGRFDTTVSKKSDPWYLENLVFAQSTQTFTNVLGLNSITVNDTMSASFGWQKGSLDELKAVRVMDQFISNIHRSVADC